MLRTLSILLILVPVVGLSAQLPGPVKRLPMPGGVPGLDRIIDNPPLTTTTADAWLEAPPLDGYTPRAFQSMKSLPRGKDGRFVLRPGAFALEAQSYCLHIATRGPVAGDGYLNAPLKGSRAEVVRSILRNAEQHPGILQQDIQMLLWSLLARLEVDDLDAKLRATAAQLLSPKDLKSVSDSPWDLLDTPAGRQAVGKLPQPVRRALNSERDVRNLVRRGNYEYGELERIAMRPVSAVAGEPERRTVPKGRWMHHPNGFFIRYLSSGYPRTRIEVVVPDKYIYTRDRLGRITSVSDARGNRTETDYDDTIRPATIPGDPRLLAYAFKAIRFIGTTPAGPERHEIRDRGWTFVRVPRTAVREPAPMFMPVVFRPLIQGALERFDNLKERYDRFNEEVVERYDYYRERRDRMESEPDESAIDDLENGEHYEEGVEAALGGDPDERLDWIIQQQERQRDALRYATVVIDSLPTESSAGPEYGPWDDVAVPTRSGSQRLGMSSREW